MKNAMNALVSAACVFATLVAVAGCRKSPEPEAGVAPRADDRGSSSFAGEAGSERSPASDASKAAPTAPGSAAPPGAQSQVAWEDPPGWNRLPPTNRMRKATYRVPKAGSESEDGELAVFYFGPNQGGSIEANVERWVKQFSEASDVKRSERSANGLRQHIVEIEKGTFSSGMPGGPATPKTGFGLLGAIVLTPSGPYFFKLTGPSTTLQRSRETFFELLDSVKAS